MDLDQNKNYITLLKIGFLGFLSLVLLTLNWYLIHLALYTEKPILYWVCPAISIIFSVTALTLFSMVNSNKYYAVALSVLSLITYLIIFPKDPFVVLGGLLFLGLMFAFEQRVRSEEKSRVDFSIRRVTAAGINLI